MKKPLVLLWKILKKSKNHYKTCGFLRKKVVKPIPANGFGPWCCNTRLDMLWGTLTDKLFREKPRKINRQLAPWPKMTKPRGEHKTGAASASHYSRPPWLNSNILSKARHAIWKIFALRRHDFRYTTVSWVKHVLRSKIFAPPARRF